MTFPALIQTGYIDSVPFVSSITNVGTMGGTCICNGGNFINEPAAWVEIGTQPVLLAVVFSNSNQLFLTLPSGSYAAGVYTFYIMNPDGTIGSSNIFNITLTQTPQTIFGGNLIAQWIAGTANLSGSNITSVPDNTGNGNTLSLVSSSSPTYNSSDSAYFMNPASIGFSENNSQYLACPSLSLGTNNIIYVCAAINYTGTNLHNVNTTIIDYNTSGHFLLAWDYLTNKFLSFINGNQVVDTNVAANSGPAIVVGGYDHVGGDVTIKVDNISEISTSTSQSVINNEQLTIAAEFLNPSYQLYGTFSFAEIFITNIKPTASQYLAIAQYFNDTYGVTPPPTYISSTPITASLSNAPFRISGTNFLIGVTITVGGQSCITIDNTSTYIDVTAPSMSAGTYDLIITNPDGHARTFVNVITVTTTTSVYSIFGTAGAALPIIADFDGNTVTQSGGVVSAWNDQSQLQNTPTASGTAQPGWQSGSGDPTFNNNGYVTFNGTSQTLEKTLFQVPNVTGLCYLAVVNQASGGPNVTGTIAILRSVNKTTGLQNHQPYNYDGTNLLSWGANITGTQNVVGYWSTTLQYINVANNATPITASHSYTFTSGTDTCYVGSANGGVNFHQGPIAKIVILNSIPTGTQLSNWESYCRTTYNAS